MAKNLNYILIRDDLKKYIKELTDFEDSDICQASSISVDKLGILKNKEMSFSKYLQNLIDVKNMTDVECYKNANIDRKLFSKIRSCEDYKPSKNTVLAFAIGLKLNFKETQNLLKSAGYSLSNSFVTDIIVEYFIEKEIYDINLINIALNDYNLQPLGSL